MKKPRSLKIKRYAVSLIHLNQYLASFTVSTMADKIGVNELNEILSKSMPNIWCNKACIHGFDCESIKKKPENMFEYI